MLRTVVLLLVSLPGLLLLFMAIFPQALTLNPDFWAFRIAAGLIGIVFVAFTIGVLLSRDTDQAEPD